MRRPGKGSRTITTVETSDSRGKRRRVYHGVATFGDGETFQDTLMTTGTNRRKVARALREWLASRTRIEG